MFDGEGEGGGEELDGTVVFEQTRIYMPVIPTLTPNDGYIIHQVWLQSNNLNSDDLDMTLSIFGIRW